MPKKATNKKTKTVDNIIPNLSPKTDDTIPGYKKLMVLDTPEAFRNLIKKITQEELKKFRKEDLQHMYDKAKEAYPASMKKLSRHERDNLYFIQEQLFGKLDPKLVSSLENIGETLVKSPDSRKKAIKYNLPGSGAVIVKQWKGKKLEVKIIDGGFEYKGKPYNSLSRLAKEISGYTVSGPVFFGLRKAKESLIKG